MKAKYKVGQQISPSDEPQKVWRITAVLDDGDTFCYTVDLGNGTGDFYEKEIFPTLKVALASRETMACFVRNS